MKFLLILFFTTIIFLSDTKSKESNESTVIAFNDKKASVISITSSGKENKYTFSVGVLSPDKGCNQYANWWEVISENGTLIYRRILTHSHVNEQPFVRSGGSINISANDVVIIRAHMNTSGYGVIAFKGSVQSGFKSVTLEDDFAQNLEKINPQPGKCAF